MTTLDLRPEAVLPHQHPMILIDEIVDQGEDFTVAKVTPLPGKPFADPEGNIPVWIGMEYMAQTIGAYAGIMAQKAGQPVKVGFLLGTRSYDTCLVKFACGTDYYISVHKNYEDAGLNVFDCTISLSANPALETVANATINTFQPDNVDEFMEAHR